MTTVCGTQQNTMGKYQLKVNICNASLGGAGEAQALALHQLLGPLSQVVTPCHSFVREYNNKHCMKQYRLLWRNE